MDADRAAALTPHGLAALQDPEGFFASQVLGGGLKNQADRNGFATVQVLRALGSEAEELLGHSAHAAALDALDACRNPATGGFRFWPPGAQPDWAPDLPDDADDTSLMATALWTAGRLSTSELRRLACTTVISHRLASTIQPGPPWPRVGAFKTWMRPGIAPDMADCTVNANVLALLAAAGLDKAPGYAEACAMIEDAVLWAGEDAGRAATLSPFYPEAGELVLAVDAAVSAGAHALRPVLALLDVSSLWRELRLRSCGEDPVICGSPYGLMRWTSPAVGRARGLRRGIPSADGALRTSHSDRR
jgi:hypothetical protein